jgi:hypothetical protein
MGQRSHHAAQKRRLKPRRAWRRDTLDAYCNEAWPWTVDEYPGYAALLADELGLSIGSARAYLRRGLKRLPKRHIERLALLSEERSLAYAKLSEDFRAYAAAKAAPGLQRKNRGG